MWNRQRDELWVVRKEQGMGNRIGCVRQNDGRNIIKV